MFNKFLFIAASVILVARATNPKGNEYRSGDCSGPLNFGHQPGACDTCVSMDATTNSVYVTIGDLGDWVMYYPTHDCTGSGGVLSTASGQCHNLNFPEGRMNSVYFQSSFC